jgi:hypothetical protein
MVGVDVILENRAVFGSANAHRIAGRESRTIDEFRRRRRSYR